MRLIGHLPDESQAKLFSDYLLVSGVENKFEDDQPSGWGIWISEEDKLDEAKTLLAEYRTAPADPKYRQASKSAATVRTDKEREQARWEKKVKGRRSFRSMTSFGLGPLTVSLMVVSIVVFLLALSGQAEGLISWLFISQYAAGAMLPEIRHGQVWRLITPIFLHFGVLHILFNMMWLRDLGGGLEARFGTKHLGLMVLALAIGSNLAQYLIGGSPRFGGMSGVVYGLLGYVWLRGKIDPSSGLFLHPSTMLLMMVWFAAAFTGVLGNVANWAHAGGLVIGVALGYMDSNRAR